MEPPLGSRSCGLVQRLRATRPGGPLFAPKSPRSIDRKSPAAPRRSQPSGCAPKSYFAPNGNRLQVTPCSRASRRRVRFGPTQAPRQTALLAFGVCHSTLLLSSRPVVGAVSAFLPRPGLAVFRHSRVSGKRSQTLNSLGGKNMMANQKPVDEIRIGRVKATIWRNGTDEQPRHNVTFSRLYKDGDQWKSTQSFGRNDLLVLAKVADLAHSRIFSLPQEEETETEDES